MDLSFSPHLAMNAWQEMLARAFDGFALQVDVSPEWLVNPATRRRLKLDRYYPEAGVAIRFAGLTAKGQGRQSDWDLLEAEQRDQTRAEVCQMNGVQLAVINPTEEPVKQFDALLRVLSRASRVLAQSDKPDSVKQTWMPALARVRDRAAELRGLVAKDPEQMMTNLAEAWRDREARTATTLQEAASRPSTAGASEPPGVFQLEQRVHHSYFGDGIVVELGTSDDDTTISILFDNEQQRTFLLSLVRDKLRGVVQT